MSNKTPNILAGLLLGLAVGLTVSVFGSDVKDWSTSAASNNASPPNGFPEGQAPSTLNDAAREVMAAIARFFTDINGSLASGGSSNAYTLTSGSVITAYADGDIFRFAANHTNTGAATLNVDGLGAQSIKVRDGGDPAAGDILSGGIYTVTYDGTNFQLLDADGIYGLARTDGNVIIGDGTAWTVESGSTLRTSLGLAIGTDVQAYDADLTTLGGLTPTSGNILLGNGSAWTSASPNETVQDVAGGMVTGNTETGMTVTYQDGDGTIDFTIAASTLTNVDITALDNDDEIIVEVDGTPRAMAYQDMGVDVQTSATQTLALADANTLLYNSGASNFTITAPSNATAAIPVGAIVLLGNTGTGSQTVAAGAGATVDSVGSNLTVKADGGLAALVKVATNAWILSGDLE